MRLSRSLRFWFTVSVVSFVAVTWFGEAVWLYRYGEERDCAVDMYELFRSSASSLRKRYALIRETKIPWSLRSKDVFALSDSAMISLKKLQECLMKDRMLTGTVFATGIMEMIAEEEHYSKKLKGHIKDAAALKVERESLRKEVRALLENFDKKFPEKYWKHAEKWLLSMRDFLRASKIGHGKLEGVPQYSPRGDEYSGSGYKKLRAHLADVLALSHRVDALMHKNTMLEDRDSIAAKERSLYKNLFKISDLAANLLKHRENYFPSELIFILINFFLILGLIIVLYWYYHSQRSFFHKEIESLDNALIDGKGDVRHDLLPLVQKIQGAHAFKPVCIEDREIEKVFQSIFRYNNEMRLSIIGLRDSIVWQKINHTDGARSDVAHILKQIDAHQDLLNVLARCADQLESGTVTSRRTLVDIARVIKKLNHFFRYVLPEMTHYALNALDKSVRHTSETIRLMNMLVAAYDALREKLPSELDRIMQEKMVVEKKSHFQDEFFSSPEPKEEEVLEKTATSFDEAKEDETKVEEKEGDEEN